MSDRRSIEIEGLSHLASIPVATRIGPLLISSVIVCFNPGTRDVPAETADQVANVYTHVQKILDEGGATWHDVAKMEFWVPSDAVRPEIDVIWRERFPDESSRPSRHIHVTGERVSATVMAYVSD